MVLRCLTIALVALSGDLLAQAPARVAVPDSGAWVRYVIPPATSWRTGQVLGREGRAIRVYLKRQGIEEVVSLDSLQRLQLATRRTAGQGAQRGALVGLLIGASGTLLAVLLVRDECPDGCIIPAPIAIGIVGALGTVALTVGGAVLGAAAPGLSWPDEEGPRQSSLRGDTQLRLAIRLPLPGSH